MANERFEIQKARFNEQVPVGSFLDKVCSQLPEADLVRLRQKAAEGMLASELEAIRAQRKFDITAAEMDEFIQNVQRMERTHGKVTSGYNMTGEFQTTAGKTTITSKKGCLSLLMFAATLSGLLFVCYETFSQLI